MEEILSQLISNYNFTFILSINIISYLFIQLFNKNSIAKKGIKILITVLVAIAMAILYHFISDTSTEVLINELLENMLNDDAYGIAKNISRLRGLSTAIFFFVDCSKPYFEDNDFLEIYLCYYVNNYSKVKFKATFNWNEKR